MRSTIELYSLGSCSCHRLDVCWVSPTGGQTTFSNVTLRLLVVKFRDKYSDILISDSRAWCSGCAQRGKNWNKTAQAYRYTIKENKNCFASLFLFCPFFFLLCFLSPFLLLLNLLYWLCMIHRSDSLKNFTEMALDVKTRYLCLSL